MRIYREKIFKAGKETNRFPYLPTCGTICCAFSTSAVFPECSGYIGHSGYRT